ncbi:MAG: hypothetical protein S4CHLAM45_01220 [Chlamydiales bacterium]|nr:hypothetical protein [Chlamydiales bacterium]MCH9619442.1 hypothetical protein [Chlamydiales bacterium]MCH9622246.1 hypothetical protein [Chlamydiales bacterium]
MSYSLPTSPFSIPELRFEIFSHLNNGKELVACAQVCKVWNTEIKTNFRVQVVVYNLLLSKVNIRDWPKKIWSVFPKIRKISDLNNGYQTALAALSLEDQISIAENQLRANSFSEGRQILSRVQSQLLTTQYDYVYLYLRIGEAWAHAGYFSMAEKILNYATSNEFSNLFYEDCTLVLNSVLRFMALNKANQGDIEGAVAVARKDGEGVVALQLIFSLLAQKKLDRAEQIAEALKIPSLLEKIQKAREGGNAGSIPVIDGDKSLITSVKKLIKEKKIEEAMAAVLQIKNPTTRLQAYKLITAYWIEVEGVDSIERGMTVDQNANYKDLKGGLKRETAHAAFIRLVIQSQVGKGSFAKAIKIAESVKGRLHYSFLSVVARGQIKQKMFAAAESIVGRIKNPGNQKKLVEKMAKALIKQKVGKKMPSGERETLLTDIKRIVQKIERVELQDAVLEELALTGVEQDFTVGARLRKMISKAEKREQIFRRLSLSQAYICLDKA